MSEGVAFFGDAAKTRAQEFKDAALPASSIPLDLHNPYLVKNWLELDALSVVYGEPGAGKSFFALDLVFHIAAAANWFGNRVYKLPQKVVYVAAEGARGLKRRIHAYKMKSPELYRAAIENIILLPVAPNLSDEIDAKALVEAFGIETKVWIFDTLARTIGGGDENTSKDMGIYVANAGEVRQATGGHVMVVHHSGKDQSRGARGSNSLKGAIDTEIEVVAKDGIIIATATKQKDMETGRQLRFQIKSVLLGKDQDGDDLYTAIVEPMDLGAVLQEKSKSVAAKDRFVLALGFARKHMLSGDQVKQMAGLEDKVFRARKSELQKAKAIKVGKPDVNADADYWQLTASGVTWFEASKKKYAGAQFLEDIEAAVVALEKLADEVPPGGNAELEESPADIKQESAK
jgi:hypothetical protein